MFLCSNKINAMYPVFYFILLTRNIVYSLPVFTNLVYRKPDNYLPLLNLTDFNMTTHLEFESIRRICKNRDMCKLNYTRICAIRKTNGNYEFKDFENSCYMFLSNMCDNPGKEFYIVEGSKCTLELTRRHYVESGVGVTEAPIPDNTTGDGNSTKPGLRVDNITQDDDEDIFCPDNHRCAPLSCPNFYLPVCLMVNRNYGSFARFYTFMNHCMMDLFYCRNYHEFPVPPDADYPTFSSSVLDWSYCAAQRYLKFMFTVQSASSMAHYGWLDNDARASKILEPWERKPGFG